MSKESVARRKAELLRLFEQKITDTSDAITVSRALLFQSIEARAVLEDIAQKAVDSARHLSKPVAAGFETQQVEQRLGALYQVLKQLFFVVEWSRADDREKAGRRSSTPLH